MILSLRTIPLVLLTLLMFHLILNAQVKHEISNEADVTGPAVPNNHQVVQGYIMQLRMDDRLILGSKALHPKDATPPINYCSTRDTFGCLYPVSGCIEHLIGAGPMIAGVINGIRRVSQAYNVNIGDGEFRREQKDTIRSRIWTASRDDTLFDASREGYYKRNPGLRYIDDDGDGRVDEDDLDGDDNDGDWNLLTDDLGKDGLTDAQEIGCKGAYDPVSNTDPAFDNYRPSQKDLCHPNALGIYPYRNHPDIYTQGNGIADHGEPNVDEDFAAASDNDVYISATDTVAAGPAHTPMGVKVVMKSYAWKLPFEDPIIPIEYSFINLTRNNIRDVYLGMTADMNIHRVGDRVSHTYVGYIDSLRTVFAQNGVYQGATPIGITLLQTPVALESLQYVFQWHELIPPCGGTVDSMLYSCMSCEAFGLSSCIKMNQHESAPSPGKVHFSFGPFDDFLPGETLKVVMAIVCGDGLSVGTNNLIDNVKHALFRTPDDPRVPKAPPSPCSLVADGSRFVTLTWGTKPGCVDPIDTWDDRSNYAESFPNNHWRRTHPPDGHFKGGRIFEGFRVYRSEDPLGSVNSFVLLREFDIIDGIGYDVGIDTMFIDSLARPGKTYWYSVTSFSIPERFIYAYPRPDGSIKYDTFYNVGGESEIIENKTKIYVNYGSSARHGEVKVVPNPYRGAFAYAGDEGFPDRESGSSVRFVKFIHLPPKATIRIYTVAGEIVRTIHHEDQNGKIGEEDFRLYSEDGRHLAPGIFVFSVDSEYGTQIGKFVVIK